MGRARPAMPPVGRDPALDLVRGVALGRVVLWHAFGAAWLTWVVAAVPSMFFVSGSLLAASFARRPWPAVLRARLRRLLVPFWGYAAAVVAVVAVVAATTGRAGWSTRALTPWVVPWTDPSTPAWTDGWGASHLWYLRALLWVLLLSPVAWWAWTRWRLVVPVALSIAVVTVHFASETTAQRSVWWWRLGDLALYGLFVVAGFAHRDGRFRAVGAARLAAIGAGFAAATVALVTIEGPPPDWVVNDSHLVHLLVGAAWLCWFGAAAGWLRSLASGRAAGAVRWASSRSLTIYLWHPLAIVAAYWLFSRLGRRIAGLPGTVGLLAAVVLGIAVIVALAGPLEDLAARRHRTRTTHPTRRSTWVLTLRVLVATAAVTVAVAVSPRTGSGSSAVDLPVAPSRAPMPLEFVEVGRSGARTTGQDLHWSVLTPSGFLATEPPPRVDEPADPAVRQLLDDFVTSTSATVVDVAVISSGTRWVSAAAEDGSADPDEVFRAHSATKLLTAMLVYMAVDEGRIDLDAPIGDLQSVALGPFADVTPRELLAHRTGLRDYKDVVDEETLASQPDIADVVRRTVLAGPLFEPGTAMGYSSTNSLVLGLLLEQRYGVPYETLADERVLTPLGLDSSYVDRAGGRGLSASGGLVTTVSDLALLTDAWFGGLASRDDGLLDAIVESVGEQGVGDGVMAYCPCTTDGTERWVRWYGYHGAMVQTMHQLSPGLTIVVRTDWGLQGADGIGAQVTALAGAIADLWHVTPA